MAELKTFVFTDICRSVDLKNEMSGRSITERDMAFIQKILIPHRERIEANLADSTGRVVSTAGDGHFLVFNNTILAALWAAEVQKSHADNAIETPGGGKVEVRVSMHVGVPQVDPAAPDNFVGKSVDYASRLNDHATGGQILVSRSVMAILEDIGLEGISFHLQGRRNLKGIGHVEVYEMLYDDHGPRPLRQQPSSHPDRQWTVIPTMIAGQGAHDSNVAAMPMLRRVGNYELESLLGSGGMGDVYKARHSQFGKVRAVKVIKQQYVATGNEEVIRRFYQEIKAMGALEHRNVVVAIDSSAPSDKVHYLVMEYIDGVSVHDLVEQQGQLEVADACEIIRQAARGLQYIHRNGMVHRDVKPSNFMVTLMDSEGATTSHSDPEEPLEAVVKILDLGLALLAGDAHDRLTRYDNKAMGTGMYMSPEQWKTTSVDIRADIYSLGCTLYHLLAGNPPFYDSDLRPEKAHEKSSVPPIRNNDVPRRLWDIIEKMLAKRPEDRYATPAEVAAELAPFCEGHDLAALVHGYLDPTTLSSALQYTRVDSGARIDTRHSKKSHVSWLSRASYWYPSRRWVLQRGLPLLLIVATVGALLWTMQQSRQQTIANAMEQARNNLPSSAEQAAKFVSDEIEKRFSILQEAADEAAVINLVEYYDPDQAREQLESHLLGQWIREHRQNNMDSAPSDSWFIVDLNGTQIARHPLVDRETKQPVDSFLKNYAHRDYFHGQGKELPELEALPDGTISDESRIPPIQEPNISTVYVSSTTGKFRVAFSVPIWSDPKEGGTRKVIGVLAMSADLGTFEVLNTNVQRGKDIVLVDLRDDYLETDPAMSQPTAKRGLILNHPHLSMWKKADTWPRVAPEVIAEMDAGSDRFVAGYRDPLAINPETTFWGSFEAVEYTVRDVMSEAPKKLKARWMVLAQQPAIE